MLCCWRYLGFGPGRSQAGQFICVNPTPAESYRRCGGLALTNTGLGRFLGPARVKPLLSNCSPGPCSCAHKALAMVESVAVGCGLRFARAGRIAARRPASALVHLLFPVLASNFAIGVGKHWWGTAQTSFQATFAAPSRLGRTTSRHCLTFSLGCFGQVGPWPAPCGWQWSPGP